jgi:hypothetical protein
MERMLRPIDRWLEEVDLSLALSSTPPYPTDP